MWMFNVRFFSILFVVIFAVIAVFVTYSYFDAEVEMVDGISFDQQCLRDNNAVYINFYGGRVFGFYRDRNKGEKWGDYSIRVLHRIQDSIVGNVPEVEERDSSVGGFGNHEVRQDNAVTSSNEHFSFFEKSYLAADSVILSGSRNPDVDGFIYPFYQIARQYFSKEKVEIYTKEVVKEAKYWSGHISHRHTYCQKIVGEQKTFFLIEPIVHESKYFLSGRECLRSILLTQACVKVDFDQPDKVKYIDHVFFEGGSSDQLTELGQKILRNRFKYSRQMNNE